MEARGLRDTLCYKPDRATRASSGLSVTLGSVTAEGEPTPLAYWRAVRLGTARLSLL